MCIKLADACESVWFSVQQPTFTQTISITWPSICFFAQVQNHHRPGHFLVKKSPNADYPDDPDYPVPDYECRLKDDIDAIVPVYCHPPCEPDRTFCKIYDYEVVMKPSSNQTQGRDGPMGRKEGETLRN